jgi:chaperone required for assembly of F1-ATPase
MSNLIAESAAKAQTPQPAPLPKKFYKLATYENGLLLDGRVAKTPARNPLIAPSQFIGETLAFEWNAQESVINPAKMPLTRLLNSIIDGVLPNPQPTKDEIVKFAGSDLICYRDNSLAEYEALQAAAWDKILLQLRTEIKAEFKTTQAVSFIEQPLVAVKAFETALPQDGFKIGAMNVITTLTGSAFIAFALFKGWLSQDEAWKAAHIDEDFQISKWGQDFEAQERRAFRFKDFEAAVLLLYH